ncbi:MAG TPA: lysylphosphatidylglycerol synthase transmembrane domain-containing protein [Vicinamibacterales bacterium]
MRRHLRTAAVLLVAGALMALFLRNTDLRQVGVEMAGAARAPLVLALLLTGCTYALRALRWQYLLLPIGHVRFTSALTTTLIGFAATALLPARAGELLRPYMLARKEGLSATATFATIIVERLLDTLTVLVLFAAYLLVFDPGTRTDEATFGQVKLGGALAAGACLAALALLFVISGKPALLARADAVLMRVLPDWLAARLSRLLRTFAEGLGIVRQPRRLCAALVLSVPLWLSIAGGIWLVTHAFGIAMPFAGSFVLLALLVVGVAVPTPGAIGGFHYFYRLGVTGFFDAPGNSAVGAAIVLHAISFVPVAVAGVLLLAHEGMSLTRLGAMARTGRAEGPA